MSRSSILLLVALSSVACATAHADRIAEKPALAATRSAYNIELIGSSGEVLDTYRHRGRFYVRGDAGERYSIHITNPTDRRVEAVVSVDGLDVIDGETADYRNKRGYIVPPHGDLQIDGFRVSTQAVAAFRFSSVSNSYAGRKGKARNVGVVGVAIFEEKDQPVIVQPQWREEEHHHHHRHWQGPVPTRGLDDDEASAPSADKPSAAPSSEPRPAPAPRSALGKSSSSTRDYAGMERRERPGLGTAFGEQRSSAVRFTAFQRANPNKPTAIAELRYNDVRGLQALGIEIREHYYEENDLALRETADPFPGVRFAQPPPR